MRLRVLAGALAAVAAGLLLFSCNPLAGPLPAGSVEDVAVQHVPYSGTFTYTVDPGSSPRDVYFVFTNPSLTQNAAQKPSVPAQLISVDELTLPAPQPQPLYARNSAPRTLAERIAEFNRDPYSFLAQVQTSEGPAGAIAPGPAQNDTVGDFADFATDIDPTTGNPTKTVRATCRLVRSNVDLGDGRKRSLSIWVDSSNWDATDLAVPPPGSDIYPMSPSRIQALADRFLRSPSSPNDIYHWDTAVVGEPWGPVTGGQLIPWDPNNTITILLANLNPSYTSGSLIVGYFWSKDNFQVSALPGSNQRIMFYIDAILYGARDSSRGETTWSVANYWPKFVFSTLAHEFQHMIHFYQKQVVLGAPQGTDTWINEMCSMIMEDLVADKLGVEGPRGVAPTDGSAGSPGNTAGRIPGFTQYSYYPLNVIDPYGLTDYSVSYAFGAWLARNYGGAGLLRSIVQSQQTDSTAIVNAVAAASGRQDESMSRLLEKWSAAVLLSSMTSAPPGYRYNTGGWTTTSTGGVSYNLGSIDVFNYSPPLTVFTGSSPVPATTFNHASNIYYQAALGLSTANTWTINLPQGLVMSVVVR